MNRDELIFYAVKYRGDYNKVLCAIHNQEKMIVKYNVNAITILDEDYPECLKDLKYPPFVLFYKGNKNLLKENMVAVVGSRLPCEYAIRATTILVDKLKVNHVIVSGLAKGIDGVAHRASIDARTIGILGCGIDYVYPKENIDLFDEMSSNHLILSEYPSKELPYPNHFPFRNRIIAALVNDVYVMQSSLKSGTLITVNEALSINRNVYALPYDIFLKEGEGTNMLIQEGANMILLKDIRDNKLQL